MESREDFAPIISSCLPAWFSVSLLRGMWPLEAEETPTIYFGAALREAFASLGIHDWREGIVDPESTLLVNQGVINPGFPLAFSVKRKTPQRANQIEVTDSEHLLLEQRFLVLHS